MAKIVETWDTKNNEEAEPDFLKTRDEAYNTFDRPDAPIPADGDTIEDGEGEGDRQDEGGQAPAGPDPSLVMHLFRAAHAAGLEHQQRQEGRWLRGYQAWKNEHATGSKYRSKRYEARSRLYRPKTRSTVRKKQAEAAAALFSSQDAIIVSTPNKADMGQQASAEVIQELVNYRLDRSNENAGIPWFMISMGAHHSAQITGLCCSKQFWEYKTETTYEEVEEPFYMPDPITGLDVQVGMVMKTVPKVKKLRDRPRVRLYPMEDVIRDPSAAWEDQAQESNYIILRNAMSVSEAKVFINSQDEKAAIPFYVVPDAVIEAAAGPASQSGGSTSGNMRRARANDGQDRMGDYANNRAFQTVWLCECFMRIEGKDYVFWTLDDRQIISEIIPVSEAYPEQGGARPIAIGISTLEPFEIDPMAPVEAWQPMQQEMNDVVNLRLDTVKQTIAPLAIVRKGRGVDVKAIQNRSVDSVAFVQDKDDLTFDRPGEVGQAAYVEMEKLNADFDEAAGNFSIGSVQTNRQLGETVGGMNLMSSNANAMGEFDLRVWIETWAEPVLRQLVKLEQYYEDDQTVLAIAGEKAKTLQKFTGDVDWDWLLTQQVSLTCNVGLGAADPMMTLQKFGGASQIALGILSSPLGAAAKPDAIIDETFGKAGFKNASERFFDFEGKDPRMQEMQQAMQEMQGALEEATKAAEDKAADRQSKEEIAKLQVIASMAQNEQAHQHQAESYMGQLQGELSKMGVQHSLGMQSADADRQFQAESAEADRGFQAESAEADRGFQAQQAAQQAAQAPAQGAQGAGKAPKRDLASMLGLQSQDPAAQMQPLVDTMMQGLAMIAQQIAAGQQQTAALIAQAMQQQGQTSAEQMAQITASQRQTAMAVAQGNERVVQAITAPKRILRDEAGNAVGTTTDITPISR